MKIFLVIVLVIATIWDAFTTAFGTILILGDGPIQIGASLLFSALIFSFVLNTRRVMKWKRGVVGGVAKFFWAIALGYDLYTSWVGNSALIVRGSGTAAETAILIGLTLLVTASPILLSAAWQSRSSDDKEDKSVSRRQEAGGT